MAGKADTLKIASAILSPRVSNLGNLGIALQDAARKATK